MNTESQKGIRMTIELAPLFNIHFMIGTINTLGQTPKGKDLYLYPFLHNRTLRCHHFT